MRLIAIFTSIFISILSVSLHADDDDKALTSAKLSGQVMDQTQELSARILAFRQLYPDIQNTAPRSICVFGIRWAKQGRSIILPSTALL